MALTYSRYLRLRLDSNLTANARYNLNRIDLLGSLLIVDSASNVNIRSEGDFTFQPNSPDLGGSGTGGTVSFGSSSQPLDFLSVYASTMNISSRLGLTDQASGGTASLRLGYNSSLNGGVDATDRLLTVDLEGADRQVVLGGNLRTTGGGLTLTLSGDSSLTLPLTGTVATLAGSEAFTNKSMSGLLNTFSNLQANQLRASNSPTGGQLLSYSGTPGEFTWVSAGSGTGDVLGNSTSWVTADGTTKVFNHGLASSAILVQIFGDSGELITVDNITINSVNQITLTSSEAPGSSWTVVVQAKP